MTEYADCPACGQVMDGTIWDALRYPSLCKLVRRCSPPKTSRRTDAALRESMTKLLHRAQRCYPHPAGAYWVPRRLGGGAPSLAEAAQIEADEAAARAATRPAHPPG